MCPGRVSGTGRPHRYTDRGSVGVREDSTSYFRPYKESSGNRIFPTTSSSFHPRTRGSTRCITPPPPPKDHRVPRDPHERSSTHTFILDRHGTGLTTSPTPPFRSVRGRPVRRRVPVSTPSPHDDPLTPILLSTRPLESSLGEPISILRTHTRGTGGEGYEPGHGRASENRNPQRPLTYSVNPIFLDHWNGILEGTASTCGTKQRGGVSWKPLSTSFSSFHPYHDTTAHT